MRQRHLAQSLGHHASPAARFPAGLSGQNHPEPVHRPLAARRTEKRGNGLAVLLDELEECLPAVPSAEEISEARETARAIDRWLDTLSPVDRTAFLRRYWYGQRVDRIAAQAGCSPNSMAKRLSRLRDGLRKALEQEGIVV